MPKLLIMIPPQVMAGGSPDKVHFQIQTGYLSVTILDNPSPLGLIELLISTGRSNQDRRRPGNFSARKMIQTGLLFFIPFPMRPVGLHGSQEITPCPLLTPISIINSFFQRQRVQTLGWESQKLNFSLHSSIHRENLAKPWT